MVAIIRDADHDVLTSEVVAIFSTLPRR